MTGPRCIEGWPAFAQFATEKGSQFYPIALTCSRYSAQALLTIRCNIRSARKGSFATLLAKKGEKDIYRVTVCALKTVQDKKERASL